MGTSILTEGPAEGPTEGPRARAQRRAILLVLAAAATFALAAVQVKALGGAIPLAELVFARNVFALPLLLLLLRPLGGLRALRTERFGRHLLRSGYGMFSMAGNFFGLVALPLATVTALGFTMPLFLTLISVAFLGERIRWRRSTAVFIGFLGVLAMVRPWEHGVLAGGALFASLFVLGGALTWALAMLEIRSLGNAGEPGVVIVIWFAIIAAVVSGVAAVPVWVGPSPLQWALMAGCGLVSALAQLMMTAAYRSGETTLIAPFEYSAILWTTALGGLIWGEWPGGWSLLGIAVLAGSGLYIWHREAKLGIRR